MIQCGHFVWQNSVLSLLFLKKPHQHFQEKLCDTNAGVSQLSSPLHGGIAEVESIRSSVQKTCLLRKRVGSLPGQQTDLHTTDCNQTAHISERSVARLFVLVSNAHFLSSPFQVKHGLSTHIRETCSQRKGISD